MKTRTVLALGLVVLAVALQLVPVDRSNPPVTADLDAPPEVESLLRRACYDCHSRETRWPWYAWVAPASWLVAHDVEEGREHLDLSAWGALPEASRPAVAGAMAKAVEQGEMPLAVYLPLHPEARLSDADRATLAAWAEALRATPAPVDAAPAAPPDPAPTAVPPG